ncbi:hypothetical protein P8A18_17865 [Streptomyces castrisilvae]|uniref:Secreted protein n=1 Tax=Streptomyces castrisilvae TaxID=3033811 RepID=A0ABY9HKU7_9ACTN|nr:hypothetical protein [Streptomyces sp. Mut1]WLQ35182.1 hypothetical protein P8A18_17865 [Streptomyces sp. Mut1]
MSRSQWCCLVPVLAVVLGLFCGPAVRASAAEAPAPASVAASAVDGGQGIPGCGKGGKRDGTEPSTPARARAAHDQAPGLAEWGLPATPGTEPAEAYAPMTPRGPDEAAPGPVELSVLRV